MKSNVNKARFLVAKTTLAQAEDAIDAARERGDGEATARLEAALPALIDAYNDARDQFFGGW